jgi:hypothetical protein
VRVLRRMLAVVFTGEQKHALTRGVC